MSERSAAAEASRRGVGVEQVWDERERSYAAGRMPTAAEVAETIAWLCSDEAAGVSGADRRGHARRRLVARHGAGIFGTCAGYPPANVILRHARARLGLRVAAVCMPAVLASGCGSNQSITSPVTDPAREIDTLWWAMFAAGW